MVFLSIFLEQALKNRNNIRVFFKFFITGLINFIFRKNQCLNVPFEPKNKLMNFNICPLAKERESGCPTFQQSNICLNTKHLTPALNENHLYNIFTGFSCS
jgi:hypothetical protein